MTENLSFKINGIKMLMKRNYNVSLNDLESHIDSTLTMAENWFKLKPKILTLCTKENKILW